jgi:S-adenosylmethionine-diacylglycerol 3-amino-3-carboxypropyl transferase
VINYSQSWEDPLILGEALGVGSEDSVLSITSGGDNTLALLLARPRRVVSLDINPAQNYLLELKLAAARSLEYAEFLEFLGVTASRRRRGLFTRVAASMSDSARDWWHERPELIERGAIHAGRFERFLSVFRHLALPLVHSKSEIETFLAESDMETQKTFYRDEWNSIRWRFILRLFSSRSILKRFARQRGMFAHAEEGGIGGEFLARFARVAESIPLGGNYFMRYCLTGHYGKDLPLYLEERNFAHLRAIQPDALAIVTGSLVDYLQSQPEESFSRFNLSDVFEALSEAENQSTWNALVKVSTQGAVAAYWNNLVPRSFPKELAGKVWDDAERAQELYARDRVFFYGSFHRNIIHPS